jgi:hypothetical protein
MEIVQAQGTQGGANLAATEVNGGNCYYSGNGKP